MPTISVAAAASKLAGKTPRQSKTRRSASPSSAYDHSTVACSVCWRLAASARPRVSSRNRSSSSAAISAGRSAATRAAASSMASGIPSRRREISPTAATFAGVSEKSPRAAVARWANKDTASLAPAAAMPAAAGGSDSGRSPKTCSPPTPSGCWLVARTRTPGQPRRMSAASAAATLARCSQLSSTSSSALLVRKNSTTLPAVDRPVRGRARNAARTACAIISPSPAACSSHSHAPSRKDGSWSAAACSARRVLPTPPGPVTVTSGDRAIAAASPASSSARPTNELSCTGRFPANAASVRTGGNSARSPGPVSWKIRTGRARSRNRCSPRSTSPHPGGRSSRTSSSVAADTSTCPPCPAAISRAHRFSG